jgi:RNA polymerase sigma-70 factor (ECF subfamily)
MPRQPGVPADADDFADVVRAHGDAVYGFVLRRVGGQRSVAEDLTQEAFLRAWRGRRGFREETSMRGWLCAIAANVVRDDARRRRRRPAEVPAPDWFDVPDLAADPAAVQAADESLGLLRTALAALPAQQREMFLLRERDGLSYNDIATALGCPVGTVMSGLSRARARLLEAVRA